VIAVVIIILVMFMVMILMLEIGLQAGGRTYCGQSIAIGDGMAFADLVEWLSLFINSRRI